MRKILCLILTFIFVVGVCFSAPFALKVTAASVSDLTFKLNSDGKSYYVADCSESASGNLVIPSMYNGLPVTGIGYGAFSCCKSLTSINIPDGITNIGNDAFRDCFSLTSVHITDIASWCNIDFMAYNSNPLFCAKNLYLNGELVTELVIPEGVTEIKDYAFNNCTPLTSITIPDSVTSIGVSALDGCSSLTSVTIPDGVTEINNSAFNDCYALKEINVSSGNDYFTSIDGVLFNKNKTTIIKMPEGAGQTSYIIPDTVTTIEGCAFEGCSSLTSVNIPDGITIIGNSAFNFCSSLKSVTIPDSVTSIGENAFWNCYSLTSVTIGDGVTSIGRSAFWNCKSVTSINIPNSITSVDYGAFASCSALTSVHITNLASWCNIDFNDFDANPLYFAGNLYLNGELVTELVIPEDITEIKKNTFLGCSSLTSVYIPDSITNIGNNAFNGCTSLTSAYIPDSITNIGINAFKGCTSLVSVTIPDSVTSIADNAFKGCTSLRSIIIPGSVTSIGGWAFEDCASLTSVTIPNGVTSIGGSAFRGCSSLSSITISNGVTSIGSSAFSDCSSLTSITIPNGVTSIGSSAFSDCSSLSSITIPDSVTSIGSSAFKYTAYYKDTKNWENNVLYIGNHLIEAKYILSGDYTIKEGIKCIAMFAFYNCSSLTSITIPDSVTTIGANAFYSCSSLKSITIPDSVTSIGDYSFYDCKSLTSVTIPDGVTRIGWDAFNGCSSLKYVFYPGSSTDWDNINISDNNSPLTSAVIHYNATDHTHSITTQHPSSEGMEGSIKDVCPVCGFVNSSETLVYVNDYITAVDTKNVALDSSDNTLTLDISASKDLNEAIIEMDGYTLSATPNSDCGFIGTGSTVQVTDSNGTQVAEYTLVVRGDVNGDSVCDVLDCMLIELVQTHNTTLDGVYLAAGDLTENGEISIEDFSAVVNKALTA